MQNNVISEPCVNISMPVLGLSEHMTDSRYCTLPILGLNCGYTIEFWSQFCFYLPKPLQRSFRTSLQVLFGNTGYNLVLKMEM